MTAQNPIRRWAIAGMAAGLSLLLAACFVTPGKFDSALDIRKDGRFTFSYKGEIFVLGMSELMKAASKADAKPFEATPCYSDEDMEKERPCSKDEIAEQKANWEQAEKARAEKDKKELEMVKTMLGGLDPTDPKAAEELASRLRRQYGWNAVTYKGNGVYDVDYRISGTLTHDFNFPSVEKMPQIVPFFVINRRGDGNVRVDTPAMAGDQSDFASLAGLGALADEGKGKADGDAPMPPGIPMPEGRFVLTTDGVILANNTDEGPKADPTGKRLEWTITPREKAGPMALIGLAK